MAASSRPCVSSCSVPRGSGVASISRATPRTSCHARRGASWPPSSAPSSSSPTRPLPGSSCVGPSMVSQARFPKVAELLVEAEADLLVHFTFPDDPSAPHPQHEPARAAEQGDQAPHRGGGHLPQPGQPHPPGGHGPRRAGRRVAGRTLLLPPESMALIDADRRTGGGPGPTHGELIDETRGRRPVTPRAGT